MDASTLGRIIDETPIVIIASKLTDTRTLEKRLGLAGADFRILILGMGSAEHRQAFHDLQTEHGWSQLPMVFVHGRCIGGEPELYDHPLLRPEDPITWTLGLAGLIPFVLGALGSHLDVGLIGPHIFNATLAYAVLILSFMAGSQWGGAVNVRDQRNRWRYVLSVIPPLVIWPAWLMGPVATLCVLLAGFAGLLLVDIGLQRRKGWPGWYLKLRAVLTTGVIVSLVVMAEAVPTL